MLKIAWRNILRNKRRSLLSFTIIIISIIVLFLVRGYIEDTYQGLKLMSINRHGYLQIAKKGFWKQNNNQRLLLNEQEISKIKEILSQQTQITNYTTELKVSGILGTEKGSHIISGTGVEPEAEQNINIKSGINLFPGDRDKILLGTGVQKSLHVQPGEWVSLMATTLDGAYNAQSMEISGSFTTGNREADNHYAILPLSFAQNLLNTGGVDKFIIDLKEIKLTKPAIKQLKNKFKQQGLQVELKSWYDLADMYHQVKGLYDMIFMFISTVVFILVFFSILEIMSMAFFERMEEIGTIRAIGTSRSQVFCQLVQEALILGILGGIFGVLLGWGTAHLINNLNITYTPPNISSAVPLSINTNLNNGLLPFIMIVISTSFSALYPAIKASRLNIVNMLRHV